MSTKKSLKIIEIIDMEEELGLIQGIRNTGCDNDSETSYEWREEDDALLRTLYIKRKCTIDVIAAVFNLDEYIIGKRLSVLNLDNKSE